jgi:glycine oxidase
MARVQITVRGGGIFGLCIAWQAAQRGARVRVIDTQAIGAGSSGGILGALAPHVPERWDAKKAFQLDSLLMAQAFWQGVEAAANLPTGYARLGRLQPIADDTALDLARLRSHDAAQLWQGLAQWQVRPATGAAWEPISATGFLIEDSLSARLHPRLALRALCAAIMAKGGEVHLGDHPDEGQVVWATGAAGLAALGQDLGRKMGGGVKGQAALLRCDLGTRPQVFVENLHIVPHNDGTVGVGSTHENSWLDGAGTDEKLDHLIATARRCLPALQGAEVIERWTALRPRALNRAPLLGRWPGRPGHFVANGGFKIGFGMAPKIAQVMVDLVLTGHADIPGDFVL